MPSGIADDDAGGERHEYERQLFDGQAGEVRAEELVDEGTPLSFDRCSIDACGRTWRCGERSCAGALREKAGSDRRELLAIQFGGRVHAAHGGVVDGAFEPGEGGPGPWETLRQIRAIEQHGVIGREIVTIVGEHRQPVLVDLGVGRVDVDRIDLLLCHRVICETMIQAARRRER